jgi:SAM-dependent methyltransferase
MGVGGGSLPVGRVEVEADFRSGAACDLKQLSVRYNVDPLQDKQALQLFGDIGIFVDEQTRGALEDGDFASETAVRLCELETNVATTDDDEMFGEAVQLEEFDILVRGLGFAQAGVGRDGGVRAHPISGHCHAEFLSAVNERQHSFISNCVINLSADKSRVFKEAFRVLRPGGRFAVSDVVVRGEVPDAIRKSMLLWVGCIAGALEESDYRAKLRDAGFESVDLEPTRTYDIEDARVFLTQAGIAVDEIAPQVEGKFLSAFIRATKPAAACCAPGCCTPEVIAGGA